MQLHYVFLNMMSYNLILNISIFFGTKCQKDLFMSVEYLREKKSFDYIFQLLFFHILKCIELKLEK